MMKLYAHQQEAVRLGTQGNVLFQHDCGCGKTATALTLIRHHRGRGDGPALVVCPLSIIEPAWLEDAAKFAPELSVVSLWHKPGSKKAAYQKRLLGEAHDVYVANYETFKALYYEIRKKGFRVLIVDESSKMKDYKTDTAKALLSLAGIGYRTRGGKGYPVHDPVPWRYALSGTPAPNCQLEYWPQVKFITGQGNAVFPDNFYAFRGQYFYNLFANAQNTLAQKWLIKDECKDAFNDKLAEVCHVVRKTDAVDLPEQTYLRRVVTLTAKEQAAYNAMEKDLIATFGDEAVLAANALSKVMKLRQMTSGFCYGADGQVYPTGRTKLRELADLLDEIGDRQVIIWANFKAEIRAILDMLPDSAALWSESDDRNQIVRDFQTGKYRYLVANPQSAAHGLTFVNCCDAVYFSLNYSYELQKQSEDRIHRIGQQTKCTYHFLIAKGTVDALIYQAVNKKANMNTAILEYLKRGNNDGSTLTQGCAKAI